MAHLDSVISKDLMVSAQRLVEYLSSLEDFEIVVDYYESYRHMGAILTDVVLQAGLNYKTVVVPRVRRVIEHYPEASTISTFLSVIESEGANQVLDWRHPEKPRRLYEITRFLNQLSIDSEQDLHNWLLIADNAESLLKIKGIGPKTVDYLKNLVDISTVAVDRHIRRFVSNAGVTYNEYVELRSLIEIAADLLYLPSSGLDHAIWLYMSRKSTRENRSRSTFNRDTHNQS